MHYIDELLLPTRPNQLLPPIRRHNPLDPAGHLLWPPLNLPRRCRYEHDVALSPRNLRHNLSKQRHKLRSSHSRNFDLFRLCRLPGSNLLLHHRRDILRSVASIIDGSRKRSILCRGDTHDLRRFRDVESHGTEHGG